MPHDQLKSTTDRTSKSDAAPTVAGGIGSPNSRRDRWHWTIFVFVLAAILRLAATSGDLAIDEVMSLSFAQLFAKQFIDIFTLRSDNNHLLNTMIIYGIGPNVPGICYRIPAAIASIASVWLAGRIAMRRGGRSACLFAWIFAGSSYLLIIYGSEARGYSYAICFAYLSWICLLRTEESGRWMDATTFAISACLGFLSHLTFLYCYAGCCVWTIWKWLHKPSWILPLAHIPPLLVASGLYLFFIRGMAIAGGPETTIASAAISTLSIVAGGPLYDDGALISALLVLILVGIGLFRIWLTDRATAACYVTIIIVAPAGVLLLTGHQLIYPRYFLIPVAFALLPIIDVVSSWGRAGGIGRTCQIMIVGAFLLGNCWWTALLLNHGRGDYSRAMMWMAEHAANDPATVSSDHDFRNAMIFGYCASRLWPNASPLHYVDQRAVPRQGTDWLIRHTFEGDRPHPNVVTDPAGNAYKLERTFRHHSLTGWDWWIYRRMAKPS